MNIYSFGFPVYKLYKTVFELFNLFKNVIKSITNKLYKLIKLKLFTLRNEIF